MKNVSQLVYNWDMQNQNVHTVQRKVRGTRNPFVVIGAHSSMSSRYKCVPPVGTRFSSGDTVSCETRGDGTVFVYSASDPAHREQWTIAGQWTGV